MVDPLRRVLVRRPDAAFGDADPRRWHYKTRPDLETACREHDDFVTLLRDGGTEVEFHDSAETRSADAIFTHDPCIVTEAGAVLLRMGKSLRSDEPAALGKTLEALGIPVHARLEEPALAEGGDLLWLDRDTLAVGQGYRTNTAGLRQLSAALEPLGVRLLPVALPDLDGPDACLHLMSLISMIDHDLAVAYRALLPADFAGLLTARGIEIVDVPGEEFPTMGPNVLATAPRECVMLAGNACTRQRLERAGCRVRTYRGEQISLNAEGGATCLTRPLWREA